MPVRRFNARERARPATNNPFACFCYPIFARSSRNGSRSPSSAELVAALIAIEGRPWAEWKAGKPLSANGLARLLAPFGIAPATIRTATGTPKGYQLAQFDDAFARYLPDDEFEPPHRHNLDGTSISYAFATATLYCLLRFEKAGNA